MHRLIRGGIPPSAIWPIFKARATSIFVVETEPRHEQATARRMLVPHQKRQVFLLKSSGPMMFDLI